MGRRTKASSSLVKLGFYQAKPINSQARKGLESPGSSANKNNQDTRRMPIQPKTPQAPKKKYGVKRKP